MKKNRVGRFTFPDFKSYYTATIIKTCGTHIYITQQIKSPGEKKALHLRLIDFLQCY